MAKENANERVAVITGASSGIGEAAAHALRAGGFTVVLGARRLEKVKDVARAAGGAGFELDVSEPASIDRFRSEVEAAYGRVDLLLNNAGLALGREHVAEGVDEDWVQMYETNVLGMLRMTRAFIPMLRKAAHAHIINIGSVAGFDVYPGGAGYTSTKHAVRAITQSLRLELNGEPIRVTEVAPGMTETEFSLVRFKGDGNSAKKVYDGMTPLSARNIADCIAFAALQPPHVNIDYLVVRPVAQASSYLQARNKGL